MDLAQSYVLVVDRDYQEANRIAHNTAEAITDGRLTLVDTVKSVADFINHDDATIRSRAVRFLSSALRNLRDDRLTRQQVTVLTEFFLARALDGGSLEALEHLQGLPRFTRDNAVLTFTIFSKYYTDLQSFPQYRRHEVYRLLNGLMCSHRTVLKGMGDKSLTVIIDLVAGEKDPRNLMIVFSVLHALIAEWDISHHVESVFESVFCYFPITFRQPPNDPYRITTQDLKERLKECLSASSLLAPYTLPQLTNKLDSTSSNVKRDVIQVLRACAQHYGAAIISEYALILWESLKFEVLANCEEDLVSEALETLKAIAVTLDENEQSNKISVQLFQFLQLISKELSELLKGPDQKQMPGISRLLHAVASATTNSFAYIAQALVPKIIDFYQQHTMNVQRKHLLETVLQILHAGRSFQDLDKFKALLANEGAIQSRERIFSVLGNTLMGSGSHEVSLRLLALKCLQQGCHYSKLFSESEVKLAIQYFTEVLLSHDDDGRRSLGDAAADALKDISATDPHYILETSIPTLLSHLPDFEGHSTRSFLEVLGAIGKIGTSRSLADTVIRRLIVRVEALIKGPCDQSYLRAILITLEHVLTHTTKQTDLPWADYLEKFQVIVRLVVKASIGQCKMTALNTIAGNVTLGRILCLIVKAVEPEKQNLLGQEVYSLFMSQTIFTLWPLEEDANFERKDTIFLSTSLLAALPRTVTITHPFDTLSSLANQMILLAERERNPRIKHGLHQHVGLLMSKFCSNEDLKDVLVVRWLCHKDSDPAFTPSEHNIQAIFWVSKALAGRLFEVDQVLASLTDILENEDLAAPSARGFGMLLANDPVMNKENGATIRLLSRQRLVMLLLPRLINLFTGAAEATKFNCLVALSGVLGETYNESYLLDIGGLIPLLLQSLQTSDRDICLAALKFIHRLLQSSSKSLESHLDTILASFQNVMIDQETSNSELRGLTLKCLCLIPKAFSEVQILNNRAKITLVMNTALDDPRRTIRKAAVDCCHIWLSVESQEGM